MKKLSSALVELVVFGAWIFLASAAQADVRHYWNIVSPDHEQTFAYGTEQSRVWDVRGRDRHLVVLLNFTNDPFVDRQNPRQYDNFIFAFPGITLGKDGRTFYYRTSDGRAIPVARKQPDFLGVEEVHLLPNAMLTVYQPHGFLTLSLAVEDDSLAKSH